MKKILLLMVALVCATMSFAQSQIATLSHGDDIKTFYGPSGFKSAMSAAEHGDIITLSSGQFEASNITKAVTLRGAGMVEYNDSTGFHAPTVIEGLLTIDIADSIQNQNRLAVDGIKFVNLLTYKKLKNPVFTKCNFYRLTYFNGSNIIGYIENGVLINCRVQYSIEVYNWSTVTCINSIINQPYRRENNVKNTYEFINCIVTNVSTSSMGYCTFRNCYISNNNFSSALPSTCVVSNCCSNYTYTFKSSINTTNVGVSSTDMFASYTDGDWTESEKFILKEDAAAKYLGDDGTQMGIYGGNMPYDEHISMPRITKCNVAGKSTADGKLSVDIQVEAAQ